MSRLKRKKDLLSPQESDIRFGTPVEVAAYRARRLAAAKPDTIIEVGAGAGFQTKEFAKVADVIAIDVDAQRMERGNWPQNAMRIAGDALDPEVFARAEQASGKTVVFLDPERPASAEHRKLSDIEPNIHDFVARYRGITEDIAIELPPFLAEIPFDCEREYLSIDGKLNRLTIYLGGLKRCDVSVVRLPEGERVEHNGEAPDVASAEVKQHYLLEPDAALQHAGLTGIALNVPVQEVSFGKKRMYFSERKAGKLFTHYHIIAIGKEKTIRSLGSCGTIILHGSMSVSEQKDILKSLKRYCKGNDRLHLFVGKQWCLCRKASA